MPDSASQAFLRELDKKLWTAADRLRSNLDAAEADARWSRSAAETAPHAKFYKTWGKYGTPPQGNANFGWVQHMLHHLAQNGSMSSSSSGEGRKIAHSLDHDSRLETSVFLN